MVNWQPYFDSIQKHYEKWRQVYTITDVEGKISPPHRSPLLLDLRVETVVERKEEQPEKTEKFDILTGLRKYSLDAGAHVLHVLLQGKPGSGKSTALARLLLEEGSKEDENWIPVLLELRAYKTSMVDMIRDFCRSHGITPNKEEIEDLLDKKRFLLLIDGINELPSDEAANEVIHFRKTYPQVPMVFTTRELGLRGNLGIEKQLTVQPLTETQMKDFVRGYLGNDELIKQLRNERLRKLGETPLLLWMLCSIYSKCGRVPDNLGETFRAFTGVYDDQLKADVLTQAGSKDLWADSLQYLAFQMTVRKDEPVIRVEEAEGIIGDFLRENGENDSLSRRRGWLDDLIRLHLLQKRNEDSIEFHHQLIQEYYAAEYLSKPKWLENLSERDLQWRYLNHLKWTEPIALMLGLLKDKEQALRVVRLALAVDFGLGARLAGEVNPLWQEETVRQVTELPVSTRYRFYLLGKTGSERAVEPLIAALGDEDSVRVWAAWALGEIGSERAVEPLIAALGDEDIYVRAWAADALGNIGSERAVELLIDALGHEDSWVREWVVRALGKIGSERAVEALITTLGDEDDIVVLVNAAEALKKIDSERTVEALIPALKRCRERLWDSVDRLDSASHESSGSSEDQLWFSAKDWRNTAHVVEHFIGLLKSEDSDARIFGANTLGEIGSERAVEALITALGDEDGRVGSSAADALGKIGSERTILSLVNNLKNPDFLYPWKTIEALEAIQNKCQRYALEPMYLPTDFQISDDKWKYLARAGFTLANPDALKFALIQLIQTNPAIEDTTNEYGTFYRVEGELIGSNQVRLSVVTIWLKRNLDHQFQFIILKPRKEQ